MQNLIVPYIYIHYPRLFFLCNINSKKNALLKVKEFRWFQHVKPPLFGDSVLITHLQMQFQV